MYDFRYSTTEEYISTLEKILYMNSLVETDDYNELMDEFMEFYEVSGSG